MKKDLVKGSAEQEKIYLIIGMLLTLLFYSVFSLKKLPLHTSSDELGAIVGAAYIAGCDWSGVISGCGYYGMGYYFLFAPLFMCTDDPLIIYRVILICNGVLKTLIVWVAFRIFTDFIVIGDSRVRLLLSMLCSFMYTARINSISNEYILELLIWIVLFLCCKVIKNHDNIKRKNAHAFLLLLTLAYGLLIHTRWVTVIIAVIIMFGVLSITYRKLFFPLWQVLIFAILYAIEKRIIELYQSFVWQTGETLRNGSVTIEKGINIFDINTWKLWLDIIGGNMWAMTIFTGGFFAIAVVAVIYAVNYYVKAKERPNIFFICINIVMILCIGATIVGLMVSGWFSGMFPTFAEGKTGLDVYAYKGLTYLRYWEIYVPPVAGCSFAFLYEKKAGLTVTKISIVVVALLQIYFLNFLLPVLENNQSAFSPLFALGFFKLGDTINRNSYLCSIVLSIMIMLIFCLCIWKKKNFFALFFLLCFFLFQYSYTTINYDDKVQKSMREKIDASVSLFSECEEQGISFSNIYGLSDEKTDNNWKLCYILQFHLNKQTVMSEKPKKFENEDLVITNDEDIMEDHPEAKEIQIDDDEYWYVFDENYFEKIDATN